MTETDSGRPDDPAGAAPRRMVDAIRSVGVVSWSIVGVIIVVIVAALAVSAVSGILIPLVIATILGIVLEPVAAALRRRRVPPVLATLIVMLGTVVAVGAMSALVIVGIVDQWSQIYDQLMVGWSALLEWLRDHDLDTQLAEHARTAVTDYAPQLGQGLLGVVTSTFYGLLSLILGTFFALFFLFFVLRDGYRFPAWVAKAGLDPIEVSTVADLSRKSVRGYFSGTAKTAVITAPIFMIPMLILGVPLPIPIFILYFFLSFLPYIGAWVTGAVVVLIAFGSGGTTAALIMAVTFVVSNGSIQSAVSSWALGSSLKIHPVLVLLSTIIGGTVAGMIGMVLGPPVVAAVVKSVAAVRDLRGAPQMQSG
ncbi:AI-2E family transporter [Gordonia spumicola]|uniref:AI-2E family transporter n=1 Tax=Gordonia spumicola TaxID=589161 RepID=A0A7I9VAG6_9ACTN|nr:AI-2E family transporter [Gordonia spumicola]GEE02319.1 AI-2E family transporter [Gordonia spumicola]